MVVVDFADCVRGGCVVLVYRKIVEFGFQSGKSVKNVHHGFVLFRGHGLPVLADYIQSSRETAFRSLFVALAFAIAACLAGLSCDGSSLATLRAFARLYGLSKRRHLRNLYIDSRILGVAFTPLRVVRLRI